MFEIRRTLVGVVTASAGAGALDGLVVPGRAFGCRTADDELMLLSVPQVTDEVVREVSTRLATLDPDALVIDTTDGWATSRPKACACMSWRSSRWPRRWKRRRLTRWMTRSTAPRC